MLDKPPRQPREAHASPATRLAQPQLGTNLSRVLTQPLETGTQQRSFFCIGRTLTPGRAGGKMLNRERGSADAGQAHTGEVFSYATEPCQRDPSLAARRTRVHKRRTGLSLLTLRWRSHESQAISTATSETLDRPCQEEIPPQSENPHPHILQGRGGREKQNAHTGLS